MKVTAWQLRAISGAPPGSDQTPAEDLLDPGVEANARLTAATGLLLAVMLAAEGFTILAIHPLLSWHVAIGMALIPPVGLKMGSTFWRFTRYYVGDPRYGQAGPPHPVLRVLGPVLVLTTAAVLASGVAAWVAGHRDHTLLALHKASFLLWFAAMAIHFLAHILRSARLTAADFAGRAAVPFRSSRHALVIGSLVAGIVLAVATRGLAGNWSHLH